MANTGWTWDDALDTLTLPRYLALREQWKAHPPVHWLVAAALGVRSSAEQTPASRRPSIAELNAVLPQGRM